MRQTLTPLGPMKRPGGLVNPHLTPGGPAETHSDALAGCLAVVWKLGDRRFNPGCPDLKVQVRRSHERAA